MAKNIQVEQPPSSTDAELSEYLNRTFTLINIALGNDTLVGLTALPAKPQIGRVYYFKQAIASDPDITAEGFYGYLSNNTYSLLG